MTTNKTTTATTATAAKERAERGLEATVMLYSSEVREGVREGTKGVAGDKAHTMREKVEKRYRGIGGIQFIPKRSNNSDMRAVNKLFLWHGRRLPLDQLGPD